MPAKLRILLIITAVLIQIIASSPSFAAADIQSANNQATASVLSDKNTENIQIFDNQKSRSELIIKQNDKTILTKKWFTYEFEVDISSQNGQAPVYPINSVEYQKALDKVDFPLKKLGDYKVYFLDYKLKNYSSALALSFMDDSVVVLGSSYQLTQEMVHRLAIHELGHQVDFQLMNQDTWRKYIEIRGISNERLYNNWSPIYQNRPQEIFAEDFRLLFGGEEARKIPHLNQELVDPNLIPGLKEFYLSLA